MSDTIERKNGINMCVSLVWRGRYYTIQFFFPGLKKPSRAEIQDSIQKIYPGARVNAYYEHPIDRTSPIVKLPEQEQINQEVGETPDEDPLDAIKKQKEKQSKKRVDNAEKRISMIKKLVLLKKRQAVNKGGGSDITV
tara:strand:+ start:25 stop:438 length:414 start_codon:yes stop_codon:yes gene_type:complete